MKSHLTSTLIPVVFAKPCVTRPPRLLCKQQRFNRRAFEKRAPCCALPVTPKHGLKAFWFVIYRVPARFGRRPRHARDESHHPRAASRDLPLRPPARSRRRRRFGPARGASFRRHASRRSSRISSLHSSWNQCRHSAAQRPRRTRIRAE
jgi:hypothetical protein